MKDLLNLLKAQGSVDDFDALKLAIESDGLGGLMARIDLDAKGPTKLNAKRDGSAPTGNPGGNYQIFPGEGQQFGRLARRILGPVGLGPGRIGKRSGVAFGRGGRGGGA